jgi:Methyltransferase domain
MNKAIKILLGLNIISFLHLVTSGPVAWLNACWKGFVGAWTFLPEIPEIALGEILGDRTSNIKLSVTRHEDGRLPDDQALCVVAIAVYENPREILEIGTYMGHTTRQLAENLPNSAIHTVDLPESFSPDKDPDRTMPKDDLHLVARRTVGREFLGQPCASHIIQHFGDSANWDFAKAGKPTFFFIDGAHTYEYCKSDSEKCFALCGGKGVFLWHDCDRIHPGIIKFVAEWRKLGRDLRRIAGTPLIYWKSN